MFKKDCFGVLDNVFPMGKEGLREVLPGCFECGEKTACLQKALATREGLEFRTHILDRTSQAGLIGKLKRWSERKELSRLMKEKKGKRK